MLLAFVRGITRELIALLAWVLGFLAAVAFSPLVGAMLPEFGGSPVVRYLVAFVAILLRALLSGRAYCVAVAQRDPQGGAWFRRSLPGRACSALRAVLYWRSLSYCSPG